MMAKAALRAEERGSRFAKAVFEMSSPVRRAVLLVAAAAAVLCAQAETNQPATNQPATNQPATNQPATNQPATNQPATNQPATNQPVTNGLPAMIYGADTTAGIGTNSLSPSTPAQPPSFGKISLSVIFYPIVLLLLAVLAIYLMRSGWPAGLLQKKAPRKLQVSEIRPLGNRQFLVVAEYEATRLLLGVSHGRIDLLCHLAREEAAEEESFASLMPEEATKKTP